MRGMKAILVLLCTAALLPWAAGRVFRIIGVREGRLNTAGLPWEFAYQTTMNIHGRRNAVRLECRDRKYRAVCSVKPGTKGNRQIPDALP